MSGEMDKIKGKVKETVGDATGNDDLEREGKTDHAAGTAKDKLDDVKDSASDAVDSIKDKLHGD